MQETFQQGAMGQDRRPCRAARHIPCRMNLIMRNKFAHQKPRKPTWEELENRAADIVYREELTRTARIGGQTRLGKPEEHRSARRRLKRPG